ncbi:DNA-directed RNA polymerase subunit D [Candidatus Woesearchaeota archaeon]|nr:DNA-directed RNA polymerase subunit D [Candidatus Woesearchaeota archaeon]
MTTIQLVSKDKKTGRVNFLLKDATHFIANTLRRFSIESVPTMAIEDVEFRKNNTALYDEQIAHRLGLITLKTDLKAYTLPQECKCNGAGCNRCTVILTLKAKGPGNVYAKDLKSKDPKIVPVYPDTLLTVLTKGQELEIEATAVLGQGKNHVKWSPGLCWYFEYPKVTVNNSSSKLEECKARIPSVAVKDGKVDKQAIIDNNLFDAVEGVCEDVIKLEYDGKTFMFNIEPWGQLNPSEILSSALEQFQKQIKELEEKL